MLAAADLDFAGIGAWAWPPCNAGRRDCGDTWQTSAPEMRNRLLVIDSPFSEESSTTCDNLHEHIQAESGQGRMYMLERYLGEHEAAEIFWLGWTADQKEVATGPAGF